MGKVVKTVVGVAAAIVGVVTQQYWLVGLGLSLASSSLLRPKLATSERQASETTISLGEHPRVVLFGTTCTGPGQVIFHDFN